MVRPNYRDFRISQFLIGAGNQNLKHSAKGTTWEEHKYIKRINGTYYYPDSYKGGRHLPDGEKNESDKGTMSKDDILTKLEDMTGMKREGLTDLYNLSREKGYDSAEFKQLLRELSEGDDDQAKRMIDLLKKDESKVNLSAEDIEALAKEVIRGNFGNGEVRKELLGEFYSDIQKRVNEILNGSAGSKNVSEATTESVKAAEEAAKNASTPSTSSSSKVHSGVDMDKVLSVYKKK